MRPLVVLLLAFCSYGQAPSQPPTIEDIKKRVASYPPDEQVYELWRFWLVGQAPNVQKLFDQETTKADGLALYRKALQAEGDTPAQIASKLGIIDKDGERWEIERWNRILTSNSSRINWQPNAFPPVMIRRKRLWRSPETWRRKPASS